jgi:hypothetical protein
LKSPELGKVREEILDAVKSLRGPDGSGKVMLVIDQLDLLLVTGGQDVTSTAIGEMLMDIRQVYYPSAPLASKKYATLRKTD